MKRKLWAAVLVAVALTLVTASVVQAEAKTPISCSLTLAVTNAGTVTFLDVDKFKTEGEQTLGALNCDDDSFDGSFATEHASEVTVGPVGSLSGELKGTFTLVNSLGTITGKLEADISGAVIGEAFGFPIHQVTDLGKWEFNHDELEGEGTFAVTLVGVVGAGAPFGLATIIPGSLVGEVEAN